MSNVGLMDWRWSNTGAAYDSPSYHDGFNFRLLVVILVLCLYQLSPKALLRQTRILSLACADARRLHCLPWNRMAR